MTISEFYASHSRGHLRRMVLMVAFLMSAVTYFTWRIFVFNTEYPGLSAAMLLMEFYILISSLAVIPLSWKVKPRAERQAPEGLKVDVFVPTYNESADLVRRTTLAAMHIDYPHETWILDDGDRPEIKAVADELGCHYLARSENTGAKPGNLNNALKYAKGDYIAVIDCDHIAQRDYLDRLLGHFDDPKVAFVQAPQDYYNTNAFQFDNDPEHGCLWHDQSLFFQIGQAGRDYIGATSCCGTSTIVSRAAIEAIGGFPETTCTEDIHVAIKSQKLGYKTVYYPITLAYGVAPVDLGEFQRQRLRWGQGNVQAAHQEKLPFTTKLGWIKNLAYTFFVIFHFEGWARLISYFAPFYIVTLGSYPITPTYDFLWYFVPYVLLMYFFFDELGRGNTRLRANEQMAMSRFVVYVASTLAYFKGRIPWVVSSKAFIGNFEVDLLIPQILVFVANVAAIVITFIFPDYEALEDYGVALYYTFVAWCAWNAYNALLVMLRSMRSAENKRADYRFPLPLPIEVNGGMGRVDKLSATGLSFFVPKDFALPAGAPITGTLFLPGKSLAFTAVPEPGMAAEIEGEEKKIYALFEWGKETDRDILDQSLHACVWHRKRMWFGVYWYTALERLACRLGLMKDTRPTAQYRKFVLTRSGEDDRPELGILIADPVADIHEFIGFSAARDEVKVIWREDLGLLETPHLVEIADHLSTAVASSGPNDVKMHTYQTVEARLRDVAQGTITAEKGLMPEAVKTPIKQG
ncbi:MAG: glycosyltransferase [Pseudomonadota bacterium]